MNKIGARRVEEQKRGGTHTYVYIYIIRRRSLRNIRRETKIRREYDDYKNKVDNIFFNDVVLVSLFVFLPKPKKGLFIFPNI